MASNDKIDDLPPLVSYNNARFQKEPSNAQKPILVQQPKPQIAEISPGDLMLNILSSNMAKSNEPTPKNEPKSQVAFPQAPLKDISSHKLQQIRKNRNAEKASRVERDIKPVEEDTDMEIHKTNKLINQMINKVATKNVADEMFPISLETINKNIEELKGEVQALRERANEIQTQLYDNPKNAVLQKEKDNIEKTVEKLEIMKYLYLDKIDMRSENKRLLQVNQKLKQEIQQIRARVNENLERVGVHINNLPCERQRNLMIELQSTRRELQKERRMRENLQSKVQNTIQDFARLYEEADVARKIVVSKLKEIQLCQQQVENGFLNGNYTHPVIVPKPVKDLTLQDSSQKYENNAAWMGKPPTLTNKIDSKRQESDRKPDSTVRKAPSYSPIPAREMNMEDKINKMRNNQITFKKLKF